MVNFNICQLLKAEMLAIKTILMGTYWLDGSAYFGSKLVRFVTFVDFCEGRNALAFVRERSRRFLIQLIVVASTWMSIESIELYGCTNRSCYTQRITVALEVKD